MSTMPKDETDQPAPVTQLPDAIKKRLKPPATPGNPHTQTPPAHRTASSPAPSAVTSPEPISPAVTATPTTETATSASPVLEQLSNRFEPIARHLRVMRAATPSAKAVGSRIGALGASVRTAARTHLPPLKPGKLADVNARAGQFIAGLRSAGLRIGTTLDAIVERLPRKRAATPAARPVPTFDTTPPEVVENRPSVFALGALATAFVTAGLIHLVTTFAIPLIGTGSAYTKLKPVLPLNRMVVFPLQTPGRQILPFIAPDMLYAICRFDVSASPVIVKSQLPGLGWSLTLYTPAGDNFYAMPGTGQGATDVAFMMVPPTDRLLSMMPGARREDMKLNQIVAPTREGLIVVRAPVKSNALIEETRRELAESACKPSELAAPLR